MGVQVESSPPKKDRCDLSKKISVMGEAGLGGPREAFIAAVTCRWQAGACYYGVYQMGDV